MATFAIGDIQGCYHEFSALLKRIDFRDDRDVLWSVGDVINRGANNIETLRWLYHHRDQVKVVLGNHDLHLLATWHGAARASPSDNFHDVLAAPDAEVLLSWLQRQPLIWQEMIGSTHFTMVHAGIPPIWDTVAACALADEVSQALSSTQATQLFKTLYGNEPVRWSSHICGWARLRLITNYLTRMRFCTVSGALDLKSKEQKPKQQQFQGEPLKPWFEHQLQLGPNEAIVFGHWAALQGQTSNPQAIALDTGCVWGNALTAIDLETRDRISVRAGAA